VGCYIWYSEEGPGRPAAPPSPLLSILNVTAHQSTASVTCADYRVRLKSASAAAAYSCQPPAWRNGACHSAESNRWTRGQARQPDNMDRRKPVLRIWRRSNDFCPVSRCGCKSHAPKRPGQETQLSQRGRGTLHVVGNSAKSLKVI